MIKLTRPVGGPIPNPIRDEVMLVQRLLNKHRLPPLAPLSVDGREGPETKAAIVEFQTRVLKMTKPDGRVDPEGPTFRALASAKAAAPSPTPVTVTFHHRGKQPMGVVGLPGAPSKTTSARYESLVSVSGSVSGNFVGSIFPDNIDIKGRLKDGTYDLYLGFHHSGTPTPSDLLPRTQGFRAVLVVNANKPVPVISNDRTKVSSDGIHVHNGYNTWSATHPMSEGCLILAPDDWFPFIKLFIAAYPDIADWTAGGGRLGKKIGVVTVAQ